MRIDAEYALEHILSPNKNTKITKLTCNLSPNSQCIFLLNSILKVHNNSIGYCFMYMKFGSYPFGTLKIQKKRNVCMELDCVGYHKRRNANLNILIGLGVENVTCSKRLFYSFSFS